MKRCGVIALGALLVASPAAAQTGEFLLRGFADFGSTTFTAERSFEAVLGSKRGPVFGGGVEAVFPQRLFVGLRASRFSREGQRVFIFEDREFDLGIPTTVTITPLEIIGGYRFDRGWRVIPYAGGGIGWHRYAEESAFATSTENVDERFQGYQILGGAEFRLANWLGAAGEAQWTTVPDALGDDPNSVSREFDESNLGGVTFRLKIVVGR